MEQIKENPESSYAEWMIFVSGTLAKLLNCPFHLVDRSGEDYSNNIPDYYLALKGELGFTEIAICCKKTDSISSGGTILTNKNGPIRTKHTELYMTSVKFS